MKCLLKYQWVKLPRTHLPQGKGVLGHWARLASKAAFRNGKSTYCGYTNKVSTGTWTGGIVGVKSILGIKGRQEAIDILDALSGLGYLDYQIESKTKKLTYKINDFVLNCSGADCLGGEAVYTTNDYGFLCLPRNITERLVQQHYKFEDADAWLDLWCHTAYQDPCNAFTYMAPAIQFGRYGAALTLENLGARWGWEKTKVWRFMQKHADTFKLHKLPGSYGCLIFNTQYPTAMGTGKDIVLPEAVEIVRILEEIRIMGENTHFTGSDNERINHFIAWYSKKIIPEAKRVESDQLYESRVALSAPIIRAYFSLQSCKNYKDCRSKYIDTPPAREEIRGPCQTRGPTNIGGLA